jgi:hypothetical protein
MPESCPRFAVNTQSAGMPVPEEDAVGAQGSEVVQSRYQRPIPTREPSITKIGEEIMNMYDIGSKVPEFS